MEFEVVEQDGRVHVSKNGVRAQWFAMPDGIGYVIYEPRPVQHTVSLEEALVLIAEWMGDWYTIAQAAEALAEMGTFDEPPSAQRMGTWARAGLFPGAVKIKGPGARGGGGSWRISASALPIFAERRKGQ